MWPIPAARKAVELSLIPLAKNLLLNSDIHTTIVTGATSEGAERRPTTHYAWRNDNMVVYRPFAHPQMPEILQVLRAMQQSFDSQIHMLPMRGSFSRGIMAVSYLDCPLELTEIIRIYSEYFADHNFTFITSKIPDLKDVVNTNKCIIHLDKIDGKVLITAVIDNLLKRWRRQRCPHHEPPLRPSGDNGSHHEARGILTSGLKLFPPTA